MSEQQARAVSKTIWRYLDRINGYQPYGYDWRTLRITHPQIAAVLRRCYDILSASDD